MKTSAGVRSPSSSMSSARSADSPWRTVMAMPDFAEKSSSRGSMRLEVRPLYTTSRSSSPELQAASAGLPTASAAVRTTPAMDRLSPIGRRLAMPPSKREECLTMSPAKPVVPNPVVVVLPAHDEEATVADVVRRAPRAVLGHPVEVVVVDDGSRDGTAAAARAAGATVHSLLRNRGLGAAVRAGLAWAIEQRAAAVAFLDADGEYAPEGLENLVAPILAGRADYVIGSRFAGPPPGTPPHPRPGGQGLSLRRGADHLPVPPARPVIRQAGPLSAPGGARGLAGVADTLPPGAAAVADSCRTRGVSRHVDGWAE